MRLPPMCHWRQPSRWVNEEGVSRHRHAGAVVLVGGWSKGACCRDHSAGRRCDSLPDFWARWPPSRKGLEMTMDHDGRMLADALENPVLGAQIDILQVVAKLRYLADRLDTTLKIAND